MNKIEFNTQIATTIEQSKRLLELGVNPNTADMSWILAPISSEYPHVSLTPYSETKNRITYNIIPAWSLHRLIELYKDVEDTSMWSLENVNYNRLIQCIGLAIKHDAFNKDYLK